MITRELQKNWWDWLGTAERLQRSLTEQSAALALRDVGRVEKIQPELERLSTKLQDLDRLAAASTLELAESLGVTPKVRSIVDALPPVEARQVESLANRIRIVGDNVKQRMSKNRALIESELDFVHGSIAIVAEAVQNNQGDYAPTKSEPILVNQVA